MAEPTGTLFALDGWDDKLAELKSTAASIKAPKMFMQHPGVRAEEAIAAPEAFDPKTDIMCGDIMPASEVVKTKDAPEAKALKPAQVLNVMDTLLSYQSMFAEGTQVASTLDTCTYLHVPSLTEGTALGTFVRATEHLRTLITAFLVHSDVRDGDEEFTSSTYIVPMSDVRAAHDGVCKALNDAMASADASVKARLTVQLRFIELLDTSVSVSREPKENGESRGDLIAAADALVAAVATLQPLRTEDAIVPDAGVFAASRSRWGAGTETVTASTPATWQATADYYSNTAKDVLAAAGWTTQAQNFTGSFVRTVRDFTGGDRFPSLIARSVAIICIVQLPQLYNVAPIEIQLLAHFRTRYGAPAYEAAALAENDEQRAMRAALVEQRLETMKKMNRGQGPLGAGAEEFIESQLVKATKGWCDDTARLQLMLCAAYLKLPGRCHRNLANIIPNMASHYMQTVELERGCYLSATTQVRNDSGPLFERNEVLSAFIVDMLVDTVQHFLTLLRKLNLLTDPELPAIALQQYLVATTRADNYGSLHIPATALAQAKQQNSRFWARMPPAVRSRVATDVPEGEFAAADLQYTMAHGTMFAFAALKKVIPQLAVPEGHLQTTENIYNHRCTALFNLRKPAFVAYRDAITQLDKMGQQPDNRATKQAADLFRLVPSKCAAVKDKGAAYVDPKYVAACEDAAKKNAIVVTVAATLKDAAKVSVSTPMHPMVVVFTLEKK